MKRAAILIGVNKTGKLPRLADAAQGAARMEAWALEQGLERDDVLLFTDAAGPLDVGVIKRAIRQLVDSASVGQLLVYFAGHGVNLHRGEYWLLSDAPVDTQAAINVEGSIALARRAGIPHVVFVSDACRTAAEGIQAQAVTGSEIFPNDEVSDLEQAVDIFFASTLGKPAFEIKDPTTAAAGYRALYTDTLLHGLRGELAEAVDTGEADGEAARLVRPRPLKKALLAEVSRRIAAAGLQATVNQVPDARITSEDEAWLARLPPLIVPRGARVAARPHAAGPKAPAPRTLQAVSGELLDTALGTAPPAPRARGAGPDIVAAPEADALMRGAARDTAFTGATHFETRCGFKIQGARVTEALSAAWRIELIPTGDLVRVYPENAPAASVLLVFEDGSSALLPAAAEFLANLRFEDGELADVSYEPSEHTWRWDPFMQHLAELRALRNTIAAAASLGVFRLEGDNALALARRMQYAKGVDPSLALYAAYAYHDLGRTDLIREMAGFLKSDLGFLFTDVGLLARRLDGKSLADAASFAPPLPMLAQGWSLLRAFRVGLPAGLAELQGTLLPSLWTHFSAAGTARLRPLMLSGSLR